MGPDIDDLQSIIPSASPIAAMGIDPDEMLASGDPQGYLAAKRAGVPFTPAGVGQNAGTVPSAGDMSAMAQATGTAQPTVAPESKPPQAAGTSSIQQAPTGAQPATSSLGQQLAQSQAPASSQTAPPTDNSGAPAVPSTITPTGTATDPNQQGIQRAGMMAENFASKLQAQPTLAQTLAPIQAKRTLPPQEFDPNHPEYAPTAGRRIVRGIVGGLEGLSEHGIFGALKGALDPASVGATPYSAPTRQFSIAAQRQAAQQGSLDQQATTAEKTFSEDTGRAKDIITSINDIGKNYAAGETAKSREDIAGARQETARVAGQLADIKQQVADFQGQGKTPTSYEATVAAAALEKDPARKAALNGAAKTMAATELKKFEYKAAADGGDKSQFRQSMIDAATEEVKTLQDKYTYDPRRNEYVNPNNPNDVLNPNEYTDKKNDISTKLDQQLGQKKMAKLGVRFNAADAGGGKPSGDAARRAAAAGPAATTPQTKKPAPPTPTAPPPQGAADMALGSDGQWHYRDGQKKDLGQVK